MTVCTRFAPSPTGDLHVGSVRTALYSWLYAKRMRGQFILRIEDTDRERSTPEAVEVILSGMKWLQLDWDGEVVYQTQRFARYEAIAAQLLEKGQAYRCYCSKERVDKLRETQLANKQKPRYDGHCRDLDLPHEDKPYVVRFKNPLVGDVVFVDSVRGEVRIQNTELDDVILIRSDKTPTYNFSVVVDDFDMKITHVIRGEDHINNTPRQINIFHALGAPIPTFAHIPMILGEDGKKLSKREGAASVLQYRAAGYLPQALLNYLVRLGWSHGDQEIFSIDEMVNLFDLKDINKAPSALNHEKLTWLNQHYLKTLPVSVLRPHVQWQFDQHNIDVTQGPCLEDLIIAQRQRVKTLVELVEKSICFYRPQTIEPAAAQKFLKPEVFEPLTALEKALAQLDSWDADNIDNVIKATAESLNLKLGKIAQPLRVAITGSTTSPSIGITLTLFGRESTLQRLKQALKLIKTRADNEKS